MHSRNNIVFGKKKWEIVAVEHEHTHTRCARHGDRSIYVILLKIVKHTYTYIVYGLMVVGTMRCRRGFEYTQIQIVYLFIVSLFDDFFCFVHFSFLWSFVSLQIKLLQFNRIISLCPNCLVQIVKTVNRSRTHTYIHTHIRRVVLRYGIEHISNRIMRKTRQKQYRLPSNRRRWRA